MTPLATSPAVASLVEWMNRQGRLIRLPRGKFLRKAGEADRYWDGLQGMPNHEKTWEELGEPELQLIRYDKWSIVTRIEHGLSCWNLWPDEWELMTIQKEIINP